MRLLILALLLTGCSIRIGTGPNTEELMQNYCKPCGGVQTGFATDGGLMLQCMDGTSLRQQYIGTPKVLVLGTCK